MNHHRTIEIQFQDESGRVLGGELVNPYRVVSSSSSRRLGVEIEQLRDDEIDVLTYDGGEMRFHRIDVLSIVQADEVLV